MIRGVGRLAAALLAALVVTSCATVPDGSPVKVLGRTGEAEQAPADGPVDGSNPLDLVRDFVFASGSSSDRHGSARRFLAEEAAGWNDGAGLTVLDGQFDTVPTPGAPNSPDVATIRIRGTAIGRVTSSGAFESNQATFQQDVTVVRRDGQWRIAGLPDGVVVPLSIFRDHYRAVRTWFVDPVRRLVVADLRYVPSVPARAQAARVADLLLGGPSTALIGAAVSQLPPEAELRSNVAVSPDGALVVDLTGVGDLDPGARRLLAAQVVLSLAEVNVSRVRLLVDGEPLIADRPDLTRTDVADLVAEGQPNQDVQGLVVSGGRLRQLTGPEPSTPLPGPSGDGSQDVESAALSGDSRRLAVVTRQGNRRAMLIGGVADPGLTPTSLDAATMTRPTWAPSGTEVWTVLDGRTVTRVLTDAATAPGRAGIEASELAALGPINDLRLSRDGMRVVAVVGTGLYTAAVARTVDGEVALRNVHRLRPLDLGEVITADWGSADQVVSVSRGPDLLVAQTTVDGLGLQPVLGNNLTPPLSAVAATANRPLLVTDQNGVWSFAFGDQAAWRQMLGSAPDAVPLYPG
ncbi:LpqB family beta-propeller domain-containing protein [Pseudonocardia lacus]|uniref:LpqB family beta-propeller domain-containing protein n=1 Tax=Pseudonocardia lacus TaxID=2835865 RepID=UPI001BDD49B0|nr:LpqB family beta-propeller domain-containing protein [Pseudonocardia lacus]